MTFVPHRRFVAAVVVALAVAAGASPAQGIPGADSLRGIGPGRPGATPQLFAPELVAAMRVTRTPVFTPDGREMYWSSGVGRWRSCLIRARLVEGVWRGPDTLAFSTGEWFDHNPALSPDGRRLVFASDRPIEGKPATTIPGTPVPTSDLFVSERSGDGWSAPVPLGPEINTTADEDVPVLTLDGTLYFGSSRPGGPGQGRIYRARPAGRDWAGPEALPAPVTGGAGELLNHVAPDQSYLVFHSMAPADSGGLRVTFRRADGGWDPPVALSASIRELRAYWVNVTPDGRWLLFTAPPAAAGSGPRIYWADARVLRGMPAASAAQRR